MSRVASFLMRMFSALLSFPFLGFHLFFHALFIQHVFIGFGAVALLIYEILFVAFMLNAISFSEQFLLACAFFVGYRGPVTSLRAFRRSKRSYRVVPGGFASVPLATGRVSCAGLGRRLLEPVLLSDQARRVRPASSSSRCLSDRARRVRPASSSSRCLSDRARRVRPASLSL